MFYKTICFMEEYWENRNETEIILICITINMNNVDNDYHNSSTI